MTYKRLGAHIRQIDIYYRFNIAIALIRRLLITENTGKKRKAA